MRGGGPRRERWARSSQLPPSLRRLVPHNLAALLSREPAEGRSRCFGGFSAQALARERASGLFHDEERARRDLGLVNTIITKGPFLGDPPQGAQLPDTGSPNWVAPRGVLLLPGAPPPLSPDLSLRQRCFPRMGQGGSTPGPFWESFY